MKLIDADAFKKELNMMFAYGALKSTDLRILKQILDDMPDMASPAEEKEA